MAPQSRLLKEALAWLAESLMGHSIQDLPGEIQR